MVLENFGCSPQPAARTRTTWRVATVSEILTVGSCLWEKAHGWKITNRGYRLRSGFLLRHLAKASVYNASRSHRKPQADVRF